MAMTADILLQLRPSRQLRHWLVISHGLVLAAVLVLWPDPWLRIVASSIVLVSLFWQWRRSLLLPVQRLQALADGSIRWHAEGDWQAGSVLPDSFQHPYLLILHIAPEEGRRFRLLLWPDSSDAASLRRLQIWLRWCWPERGQADAITPDKGVGPDDGSAPLP